MTVREGSARGFRSAHADDEQGISFAADWNLAPQPASGRLNPEDSLAIHRDRQDALKTAGANCDFATRFRMCEAAAWNYPFALTSDRRAGLFNLQRERVPAKR